MKIANLQRQANGEGGAGADADIGTMKVEVVKQRKSYDTLRMATTKNKKELQDLKDEVRTLELESRRPNQEDSPLTRNIRMLENRLDKAMIKYNEAQSIRKTYEQIVKRLKVGNSQSVQRSSSPVPFAWHRCPSLNPGHVEMAYVLPVMCSWTCAHWFERTDHCNGSSIHPSIHRLTPSLTLCWFVNAGGAHRVRQSTGGAGAHLRRQAARLRGAPAPFGRRQPRPRRRAGRARAREFPFSHCFSLSLFSEEPAKLYGGGWMDSSGFCWSG